MTEAKVISLTQTLRNQGVDYQVQANGAGDWKVIAVGGPGQTITADGLNNLETTHGVTARTNRAEFI